MDNYFLDRQDQSPYTECLDTLGSKTKVMCPPCPFRDFSDSPLLSCPQEDGQKRQTHVPDVSHCLLKPRQLSSQHIGTSYDLWVLLYDDCVLPDTQEA